MIIIIFWCVMGYDTSISAMKGHNTITDFTFNYNILSYAILGPFTDFAVSFLDIW